MKALVAWSSGKDSAWALHEARRSGNFEMVGALTTVTDAFGRVSMHGIREELLRAQLDAAGLPAFVLYIPFPCPNEVYEQKMSAALEDTRAGGHAHDLRRPIPGGRAGVSRAAPCRQRHYTGFSSMGSADRRACTRNDR